MVDTYEHVTSGCEHNLKYLLQCRSEKTGIPIPDPLPILHAYSIICFRIIHVPLSRNVCTCISYIHPSMVNTAILRRSYICLTNLL